MKKKSEIVKVEYLEKPSHLFCDKCKNFDTRIYKDTINVLYLTISQLSDYFNFEGKIEVKCKKITDWVRKQQAMEAKTIKNTRRK